MALDSDLGDDGAALMTVDKNLQEFVVKDLAAFVGIDSVLIVVNGKSDLGRDLALERMLEAVVDGRMEVGGIEAIAELDHLEERTTVDSQVELDKSLCEVCCNEFCRNRHVGRRDHCLVDDDWASGCDWGVSRPGLGAGGIENSVDWRCGILLGSLAWRCIHGRDVVCTLVDGKRCEVLLSIVGCAQGGSRCVS